MSKYENKYALLSTVKENKVVEKEIDKLIWKFKDDYNKLAKKFPNAALGDTQTDECIAYDFYNVLHFGSIMKKPKF